MFRYLKLIAAFVLLSNAAFAQDEEPKQNRWFGGGNFGMSFGNFTFINISPQVGYRFTERFAAGGGINFQFISNRTRFNGETIYKSQRGVSGLNVFSRVYPIRNLMLQVQPEANYVWGKNVNYNPRQESKFDPRIVPSMLVGAGLVLPSGRGAMIVSLFHDVLQNENSPYSRRPFVNVGYNVGF